MCPGPNHRIGVALMDTIGPLADNSEQAGRDPGLDWLHLVAEHDFIMWRLGELHRTVSRRSRMDEMIDEATGYEAEMTRQVAELIARCDEIRALLDGVE